MGIGGISLIVVVGGLVVLGAIVFGVYRLIKSKRVAKIAEAIDPSVGAVVQKASDVVAKVEGTVAQVETVAKTAVEDVKKV